MYLTTTSKEPKIAKRNIYCIKYLTSEGISPFQYFEYKFNTLYISNVPPNIITDTPGLQLWLGKVRYHISDGMFHTDRNDINILQEWRSKYRKFTAIIPKGAKYYVGDKNDLCSDKLIILSEKPNIFKKWLINLGFIKYAEIELNS